MDSLVATDSIREFAGQELTVLAERRRKQRALEDPAALEAAAGRVAARHHTERQGLLVQRCDDGVAKISAEEARRWGRLLGWWRRTLPQVCWREEAHHTMVECMHATSALLDEESDARDALLDACHAEQHLAAAREKAAAGKASAAAAAIAARIYTTAEAARCQQQLDDALRAVATQKRRLLCAGAAALHGLPPQAGAHAEMDDAGVDRALDMIRAFRASVPVRGGSRRFRITE
eukprot:TRINITY_DN2053_c3_g1_i1.p1 TRINITY_DN2053_c3_g1~~TRINITY_DN2053_c3_g1_i1.p1  ORF type:complete len:234 (+),score=48.86 TRINITY_DN2053_c3_g1_i1:81-782(+)